MKTSRKPRADDTGGQLPAKRRKLKGDSPPHLLNQRSVSDIFRDQESLSANRQDVLDGPQSHRKANSVNYPTSNSPPQKKCLGSMYSFPTTKPSSHDTVDLTHSSPPSPSQFKKATINGAGQFSAFAPHQGAKKLVVKNLRTTPRVDPEQYFKKVWNQLETALSTILGGEKANHSLEELYKGAENLCRHGKSAELYTLLRNRFESYLGTQIRRELVQSATQLSDTDTLSKYLRAWEVWNEKLVTIRSIFYFMDQTYLLRHPERPGITDMGRGFFKEHVFLDESLQPKIIKGVMKMMESDRRSLAYEGPSTSLKKAVAMFQELGTYFSNFEPQFSLVSETYFRCWADEEISKDNLASYARSCHELRVREMTRCETYGLDRSTRSSLSLQLDELLVGSHLDFLVNEDRNIELFEEDDANALKDVYMLLERAHKGVILEPIFSKYIREKGATVVFDEEREPEMVARLLDFKKRLDYFHTYSFDSNEAIANGVHKSFAHFINRTKKTQANWDTDNAKAGEMIAKHVDLLLKGGVKAIPKLSSTSKPTSGRGDEEYDNKNGVDEDAEINHHLSLALDLFRFVDGKAVFEAFYKKDLARRLLMGRSASDDAERNMLGRLKTECGAGFTHNLESMFKDMDLARDEMASYSQLQSDRGTKVSGPDLSVSVLSAAAWPTYPDVPVTIPPSVSQLISEFEAHYQQKHGGRKLHWKHALAHCQVKAQYPKRVRKEFVVSGFQAIVLLLFNDLPDGPSGTIPYTDIRSATLLPDPELQRTLQSLACGKYRVLNKHPKGRDVNETDTFTYNAHFSDPKTRIKINQIQLKETKEENKETHIRVAADRHFETQAAIVRIMKSRKTIGHAELVAEVIKATRTRGVLELADIKKNMDRLMEKDYMERTDGNTYAYVA